MDTRQILNFAYFFRPPVSRRAAPCALDQRGSALRLDANTAKSPHGYGHVQEWKALEHHCRFAVRLFAGCCFSNACRSCKAAG